MRLGSATGFSFEQSPSMRELLADVTAALDQRRECVYCCLVETRGPTPQKAGAAMLVFPGGGQRGTLGGGCVGAGVKQKAPGVLAEGSQKPELLTFCLDDNYGWDDGLICGGRMTIHAEPVIPTRAEITPYFQHLRTMVDNGAGCTEAVVIGEQTGDARGSRCL